MSPRPAPVPPRPDAPLAEADWERAVPRLLLWAGRIHARTLADVRGAPTPEDLVQDAVTDVLTGRRTLPPDVPLLVVLYGVIRSRVSQTLARSKTSGGGAPRYVDLDDARLLHAEAAADPAHAADLRARVLALVDGDPVLTRIVGLWFEDPDLRARDLAALLDLPAEDVYNATKRLRRRASALLGPVDEVACVAWRESPSGRPLGMVPLTL